MIHDIDAIEVTKTARVTSRRRNVATDGSTPDRPVTSRLHPFVYKTIAVLALWFMLSAWGFFAPQGYVGLALGVVSVFVIITLALPYLLSRIARQRKRDGATARMGSPGEWLASDVDTWQGRLKAWDALAAILLPIAAGAFGMTAFAVVLHIVVHHAA